MHERRRCGTPQTHPKFLDTLCDALLGCAAVGICLDSLPTGFRQSQLFVRVTRLRSRENEIERLVG